MLQNKINNVLLNLHNKLWNHKVIILSALIVAYRFFKGREHKRRQEIALEEMLEGHIKSCLYLGTLQNNEYVKYSEEEIRILAKLIIENKEYHRIEKIIMVETNLSNKGVSYLADIEHLVYLQLTDNDITDDGVKTIGDKCKNLRDLDISGNPITSLKPLYELPKLAILRACETDVKECSSSWLEKSKIEAVNLNMTAVGKTRLDEIFSLLEEKSKKLLESQSTTPENSRNEGDQV